MNLRNVLRAYSLLRQLSDDESALLNVLRTLNDSDREALVVSMSDKPQKKSSKKATATREYDHCLRCGTTKRDSSHKDQSSPDYHEFQSSKDIDFCSRCKGATEAHPVHHEKQFGGYHPFESSKKAAGGGGKSSSKSARASSLQQQITTALKPLADVINQPRCTAMIDDNGGEMQCGETVDHNSHHKQTDPDYHEFQPPASSAAGASGD